MNKDIYTIQIDVEVQATLSEVWKCWTGEQHIIQWNFASEDWCCPSAHNPLKVGEEFCWRMEAKDGSLGFDLKGTYVQITPEKLLEYHLEDGRKVLIQFEELGSSVKITEAFEAEEIHTHEQQREGWLSILNNFKSYVEAQL